MKSRRRSRELIVQFLYCLEMNLPETVDDKSQHLKDWASQLRKVTFEMNNIPEDSSVYNYVQKISEDIITKWEIINELISSNLDNWALEELAVLDRNIIRMSVCEILFHDIPAAVSINEAVEIAKKYSCRKAGNFINGVLDRISKKRETFNNVK